MLRRVPRESFSIAQVTPWPWEQHHEVNRFVERLSDELCARGHRVVVVAPSDSRELVREGRATVQALRSNPDALFADPGSASVLAVGQSLPFRRGGSVSLPLDVSRTLEDLLDRAELDFVHVHEPFAPSASSAALRHSRALNVGTFHSTTERFVSTQVARKVVELLFGRLDGRTASFAATRDLIERYFPGEYRIIQPGADLLQRPAVDDGPPEIVFSAEEERGAMRLFLRALRRLPIDLDWRATIWLRDPGSAPAVSLSRRLRERVRLAGPADGSEAQHLARATIAVAASAGAAPAPQLVLRALAGGAVPVVARLPQYEEALREGELGLLFEPRDAVTLAAQLERLIAEPQLVVHFRERIDAVHPEIEWSRVAGQFEALFEEIAARRHGDGRPDLQQRLSRRDFIHVDLHMHTDHSPDCATPVADAARHRLTRRARRDRGDRPQRDLRCARGARAGQRHQGDRGRGGQDGRPGRGDRALHRGEDPARDDASGDDRRDPPPGRPRVRAPPVRPHALRAGLRAPARRGRGDRRDRGLQPARGVHGLQRRGRALRGQVPHRGRRRARIRTWPRGWGR